MSNKARENLRFVGDRSLADRSQSKLESGAFVKISNWISIAFSRTSTVIFRRRNARQSLADGYSKEYVEKQYQLGIDAIYKDGPNERRGIFLSELRRVIDTDFYWLLEGNRWADAGVVVPTKNPIWGLVSDLCAGLVKGSLVFKEPTDMQGTKINMVIFDDPEPDDPYVKILNLLGSVEREIEEINKTIGVEYDTL